MDEVVTLVAYDPAWPELFARERDLLRQALGETIIAIHHVGSTSIPGLRAKPIIDICVESEVYPPDKAVIEALAKLGFTPHGEAGVPGRHWFAKGHPRTHHINWCPVNGAIAQAAIKFRDALRANPVLAEAYANVKSVSAAKHQIDGLEYNQDKEPFIRSVLESKSNDE